MKYCIKCVAKINDDAVYCSFCGAKQGIISRQSYRPTKFPSEEAKQTPPPVPITDEDIIISKENEFNYDLTSDNDGVLIKGLKVFDDVVKITIPDQIEEMDVKEIAYGAFSGQTKLRSVKLPNLLTVLKSKMFADCSSLEEIILPTSLLKIESRAFCGCKSLKKIALPSGISKIESFTFENCTALEEITLSAITSIGEGAFAGCTSLLSLKLPYTTNTIGERAFEGCSSLGVVELSPSIRAIDAYAFNNCVSLREIIISDEVRHISWGNMYTSDVFIGCSSLSLKSKAKIKKLGCRGKF